MRLEIGSTRFADVGLSSCDNEFKNGWSWTLSGARAGHFGNRTFSSGDLVSDRGMGSHATPVDVCFPALAGLNNDLEK